MPAAPESAPRARGSELVAPVPAAAAASVTPVAVVWCRQVDNEAESPGYTTVPEDFPGLHDTLEAIRIVGHLTVNVADTHDYWDPDPAQPLSYYPNIFLYPACGGRYTCVGRMFLSTEDRPRLGMKTLVLDTQQLLATGDFGGTVLRWHASMGGPRSDGGRPPPVPDPRLYEVLGEGFLFHKGTTEPLLAVAADQWEPAVHVVLDLIRSLPASLVALGAILAFPYFLPQPKTNLTEFTEQLPLALALMRVPRGEASGDRHEKRMGSWESAPVTVRDLTQPLPAAKGSKETAPLVLQYVRDRVPEKLQPIVARVDLVEMPRLKPHLADPERQAGRDRRKEMWRIGTAMESAALLLQRARGRHVPVNVETAKRAQEYIQARLPEVPERRESGDDLVVPPAGATAAVTSPELHPPWLQRSAMPAAPAEREVVPMSVSEDPSLLTAAQRSPDATPPRGPASVPAAPASAAPPPPSPAIAPARPAAAPAPAPLPISPAAPPTAALDTSALRAAIAADLLRDIDGRFATLAAKIPPPTAGLDPRARDEVVALLRAQRDLLAAELTAKIPPATTGLDAAARDEVTTLLRAQRDVLAAELAAKIPVTASGLDPKAREDVAALLRAQRDTVVAEVTAQVAALQERTARDQGAIESRLKLSVDDAVARSTDRRFAERIDPKLADILSRADASGRAAAEAAVARLRADFDKLAEEFRLAYAASEDSLRGSLAAQLGLHVDEVNDREATLRDTLRKDVQAAVEGRFTEVEALRQRAAKDLDQKITLLLDGRSRELQQRLQEAREAEQGQLARLLDERLAQLTTTLDERADAVRGELTDAQVRAIADLQVRLQAYTDQKLREDGDRERQKYLELLARLRGEVDASLNRLVDAPKFDQTIRERVDRGLEAQRAQIQATVDARLLESEDGLRAELKLATDRLERLDAAHQSRRDDLLKLEESIRTEIDDLDRRAQILADRLVPVVRKTWARITELENSVPAAAGGEAAGALRQDLERQVRRIDGEIAERFNEIRDRMETAISNQGRVWLTLVRQLSQLTEDRRVIEESRALLQDQRAATAAGPRSDEATSLEALPSLLQSRRRATPEPDDEPDEPAKGTTSRRRRPFARN